MSETIFSWLVAVRLARSPPTATDLFIYHHFFHRIPPKKHRKIHLLHLGGIQRKLSAEPRLQWNTEGVNACIELFTKNGSVILKIFPVHFRVVRLDFNTITATGRDRHFNHHVFCRGFYLNSNFQRGRFTIFQGSCGFIFRSQQAGFYLKNIAARLRTGIFPLLVDIGEYRTSASLGDGDGLVFFRDPLRGVLGAIRIFFTVL